VENIKTDSEDTITPKLNFMTFREIVDFIFTTYSDNLCLGTTVVNKCYKFKSFLETKFVLNKICNFFNKTLSENCSEFFKDYNFRIGDSSVKIIGIFSKQCEDYFLTTLSAHYIGIGVVPIFDTVSETDLLRILSETQISSLFIDLYCLNKLIKAYELLFTNNNDLEIYLKTLIIIDTPSDREIIELKLQEFTKYNFYILFFSDILSKFTGENDAKISLNNNTLNKTKDPKENLLFINYTSGLKSSPKGVLLTEHAIVSTINNLIQGGEKSFQLSIEDTLFSLTNLAETPEYIFLILGLIYGSSIGFSGGDVCKIFEELSILKPSVFYSYPHILVKIFEALQITINKLDEAKKTMIEKAIKIKIEQTNQDGSIKHHLWDKLLFNKVKNTLGGRVRLIITGGGHLPTHILEYLSVCCSTKITELYGVTENCGFISLSEDSNKYIGNIVNFDNIRIKNCETVGYYSPFINCIDTCAKLYGEMCVKGDMLFSGYFNHRDKTALDDEGYFHTGDYVVLVENFKDLKTNIKYIDRIENFIKTKNGFVISCHLLEEYYTTCELISHITILQDPELALVAVVILNKTTNSRKNSEDGKRKNSLPGSEKLMYKVGKRKKSQFESKEDCQSVVSNCESKPSSDTTSYSNTQSYNNEYLKLVHDPNKNEIMKEQILNSFKIIHSKYKLKQHEMVNKIYILKDSLSIENGLLTCKMKLKREKIKDIYFNSLIER
jgi:long-subunit acyl-CoA synthetase (AMP-forming)